MEQPCAIPAFCANARETIDAFARRCERGLEGAPRPAGWAPFRVGVARLPHDRAPALVSWLERRCDTTFGAAAIPLDRDRIRRGWFVRYLPDSEREGIPWEVLILDMTDGPLLKEDLPDLVAVCRPVLRRAGGRLAAGSPRRRSPGGSPGFADRSGGPAGLKKRAKERPPSGRRSFLFQPCRGTRSW